MTVVTITGVLVEWKVAAEKGMDVFHEVFDSPGIPISGETRDDHDRESACSAQSSNKHLARIENFCLFCFFYVYCAIVISFDLDLF